MIVLDSNELIYCLNSGRQLPPGELVVTDELRDEYETALLVNGRRSLVLTDIDSLYGYDEAYYYKEYAKYLNDFPGVNVASMRSLTDVSILALVACIINRFGLGRQVTFDLGDESREEVIVITNDDKLEKRLRADFADQVKLVKPTSL